jgi:hypothetical protein
MKQTNVALCDHACDFAFTVLDEQRSDALAQDCPTGPL